MEAQKYLQSITALGLDRLRPLLAGLLLIAALFLHCNSKSDQVTTTSQSGLITRTSSESNVSINGVLPGVLLSTLEDLLANGYNVSRILPNDESLYEIRSSTSHLVLDLVIENDVIAEVIARKNGALCWGDRVVSAQGDSIIPVREHPFFSKFFLRKQPGAGIIVERVNSGNCILKIEYYEGTITGLKLGLASRS